MFYICYLKKGELKLKMAREGLDLFLHPPSPSSPSMLKCNHLFRIIHFDKKKTNFDLQGQHKEVAEAVEVWSEYQNSLLLPQPSPGTLGASQSFGSPRNHNK